MKRLLLCALAAMGVHALLLGMDPGWLKGPLRHPIRQQVSMTLLSRPAPPKPTKPAPKKPIQPPKPVAKPAKPPAPKPLKPPPPPKSVTPAVTPPPPRMPTPSPTAPQTRLPQVPSVPSPPEPPAVEPQTMAAAAPAAIAPTQTEPAKATESTVSSPVQTIQEAVPLYRSNPPPKYPRMARRRGYEGTVWLEVLVSPLGKVRDVKIATSSGYPVLDKSALKSVSGWQFEPGVRGDRPTEMWVRVPIEFKLK